MYLLDANIPDNYKDLYERLLNDYKEYLKSLGLNPNRNKTKYENSLRCFLRNENLSREKVEISLKESYYSDKILKNCRYVKNNISYIFTKRVFDFLEKEDYCSITTGGYQDSVWVYDRIQRKTIREDIFYKSYLTFTEKWFKLRNELVAGEEVAQLDDVLVMKNEDKERISYRLTERLREKRDYLRALNLFNAQNIFEVDGKRYPLQSYKVFNDSSDKVGGRTLTTCGFQNLKKEKRMKSLINGKPTISLDYSSFEASVMYTMTDTYMDMVDPYYVGLDGFEPVVERVLLKKCFLVMMNSSSRLQAIAAIKHWLKQDINQEGLFKDGNIPSKNLSAQILIEAVEKRHEKVKDFFYSGKNEDFNIQNIIAEINDYVVGYMFGQKGIMVGQVHDCFIVEVEHKDLLHTVMFQAYEKVLGNDMNCRIKQEF